MSRVAIPRLSRSSRHRAASLLLVAGLALVLFLPGASRSHAQQAQGADKQAVTTPVRLTGTVSRLLTNGHTTLVGATLGATVLHLALSLQSQDSTGLLRFDAAVSDPTSPLYRHYLSQSAFVARFGPSAQALASLTTYLQNDGMQIGTVYSGGSLVDATTTVAQAERVFNIQINNYRDRGGRVFYATAQDPQLPSTIAGQLVAVLGLDNAIRPQPRFRRSPSHSLPASVPAGGYGPAELRAAYDLNPLFSGGYTGAGQVVALFEQDGYDPAAISDYDAHFGLPAPSISDISVDGAPTFSQDGNGETEVELDIEVVHALAPGARILVYSGPLAGDPVLDPAGYYDTYQRIATDDQAQTLSSSWGVCEQYGGQANENALDKINQQYVAQGQTFLYASGDDGSQACLPIDGGDELANTDNDGPHVTLVGGTSLNINGTGSSATYESETVWDDSCSDGPCASAGGLSIYWHQSDAPWQQGPGVANAYDNGQPSSPRQIPDVAADADPSTGYYTETGDGTGTIVPGATGGTSAAAPLWAGMMALNNQYAGAHGAGSAGFLNPALYDLARHYPSAPSYPPFHDISVGNNDMTVDGSGQASTIPGCTIPSGKPVCYPATAGYDLPTGLGTPDGYNLIRDLAVVLTSQARTLALQSGWNLISLPLVPSGTLNASALLRGLLGGSGGTLAAIYGLSANGWTSSLIERNNTLIGHDFALQTGRGYLVYSDKAGSYRESGAVSPLPPTWTLAAGWSLVGLPVGVTSTTNASTVLASVLQQSGGSLAALYGLTQNQWTPSLIDRGGHIVGTDFALAVGAGYLLYSDKALAGITLQAPVQPTRHADHG